MIKNNLKSWPQPAPAGLLGIEATGTAGVGVMYHCPQHLHSIEFQGFSSIMLGSVSFTVKPIFSPFGMRAPVSYAAADTLLPARLSWKAGFVWYVDTDVNIKH